MIKSKRDLYTTKNYKKLVQLNGFLKIPYHLAVMYDLNTTECFIYGFIDNATKNLKYKAFTDSETTLQALCNASKNLVRQSLKNLCNKGLIEKVKVQNENGAVVTVYRSLKDTQLKIDCIDNI